MAHTQVLGDEVVTHTFDAPDRSVKLHLECLDQDKGLIRTTSEFMGKADIDLRVFPSGAHETKEKEIQLVDKKGEPAGKITIGLKFF